MKRVLAGLLVGTLLTGLTVIHDINRAGATFEPVAVQRYRVVGTGDSILSMAYGFVRGPGGTILTPEKWINTEHGRNAYTAGMSGQASTASIWPLVLSRSMPGGRIVIEDNALGVSDTAWRALMRKIADETPDDRMLIGVFTGYRADIDPQRAAEMARRMTIMGEAFMTHPNRRFVYLNKYLLQNPRQFPDGQHPDATAQRWLRGQVEGWLR